MAGHKARLYDCNVVHEQVRIQLRDKSATSFRSQKLLFVQCDQEHCQYSAENKPPCPLELKLFAEEIEEREERARRRKEEAY